MCVSNHVTRHVGASVLFWRGMPSCMYFAFPDLYVYMYLGMCVCVLFCLHSNHHFCLDFAHGKLFVEM